MTEQERIKYYQMVPPQGHYESQFARGAPSEVSYKSQATQETNKSQLSVSRLSVERLQELKA